MRFLQKTKEGAIQLLSLDKYCIYGSLNRAGWVYASIRRTNGMIAYTASLTDKNPFIGVVIPFYVPRKLIVHKRLYDTTFIYLLGRGFRKTYG